METKSKILNQFFIGAFIFSWIFWAPGVLARFEIISIPLVVLSILKLLGAISPAVMALALTSRFEGKKAMKQMLISSINPVKGGWFLLIASLLLLAIHILSWLIYKSTSQDMPRSDIVVSPGSAVVFFIGAFVLGGGLGEEIGWRGFALDRLQKKNSALISSLILSGIWILWHLPLFFYRGTNQSLIPFWAFILTVLPLGVMLTLVYNQTKSIFAAALFHTLGNLFHEIFRVIPTEASPGIKGYLILTILYYSAAIIILILFSAKNLSLKKRRISI